MTRPRKDFAAELDQLSRDVSAELSAWLSGKASREVARQVDADRELASAVAQAGTRRHGNAVLYGRRLA